MFRPSLQLFVTVIMVDSRNLALDMPKNWMMLQGLLARSTYVAETAGFTAPVELP